MPKTASPKGQKAIDVRRKAEEHQVIYAHVQGRLGRDPQMRTTSRGEPMCTFSVASNRRYTNREGERIEVTHWVSCASYGRQAQVIAEHLKRGSRVSLHGNISTRDFTRDDGTTGSTLDLDVRGFEFTDPPPQDQPATEEMPADAPPPQEETGWDAEDDEQDL